MLFMVSVQVLLPLCFHWSQSSSSAAQPEPFPHYKCCCMNSYISSIARSPSTSNMCPISGILS
jgi:hypothetical protein